MVQQNQSQQNQRIVYSDAPEGPEGTAILLRRTLRQTPVVRVDRHLEAPAESAVIEQIHIRLIQKFPDLPVQEIQIGFSAQNMRCMEHG